MLLCIKGLNKRLSSMASALMIITIIILVSTIKSEPAPPIEYILSSTQPTGVNLSGGSSSVITTTLTNQIGLPSSASPSLEYTYGERLAEALRNSSHTHDNDLISLDLTSFAWSKMEQEYKRYMQNKINKSRPLIEQLLIESKVSANCSTAIGSWLDKLSDLEHWAALMWNSWGDFPPAGLFEGSFTDLGSYRGCLSVQDNNLIGQAQYCTLDYQPLVPTRPRFHSIFKRVLDVDPHSGQLTNGDFIGREYNSGGGMKLVSHGFSSQKFTHQYQPPSKMNKLNSTQLPATNNHNIISSGVIIELARRAQFFYYINLRIGSCWPSKCSLQDIQSISQSAGSRAILQVSKTFCVTKSDRYSSKINNFQLIAIILLTGLAMFTIIASLLDIMRSLLIFFEFEMVDRKFQSLDTYFEVCSLQRNFKKLFTITPSSSTTTTPDGNQSSGTRQLTCLNGLRIISMIWVIYGHTLLNLDYQSFTHLFRILENGLTNFFVLPTLNSNYSVDTFFVISGLLSTYIIFSVDFKFNGLLYTWTRYIRLTPQLIIVTLVFFLLPLLGDGPLYRQGTDVHAERCYKNFWVNLLYLQSYINREELCVIPSWWLSIEMTFHLISLIVIYILIRKPKLGMFINFSIIAAMSTIGAYVHYTNGFAIQYLPSIPQKYEVEMEQTQWFFHRPYPHAASYFIGLALGYILAKRCITTLNRVQLCLGWFVCAFGILTSLCASYYWNLGAPYNQLEATIYYNSCQILWPISIGWIILACSLGYGGPINGLLSAKCFVPLGRITYMTYLSHIIVVYYYAASIHQTIEPSRLNLLYVCISNIILSLSFATILSLVYEAPILNLQRMLLQKRYNRVEVRIISKADTNGLSNQFIIESTTDDLVNTTKSKAKSRNSYRDTLTNHLLGDSKR